MHYFANCNNKLLLATRILSSDAVSKLLPSLRPLCSFPTNQRQPAENSQLRPPRVVKIESDIFKSVLTPQLLKLNVLFQEQGYEIKIAGVTARDLIMQTTPANLDLATTASPLEMITLFESEGIRVLPNQCDEQHGTVACRLDEQDFEIATLRQDTMCDGRLEEVRFTWDWRTDAVNRDLTINALFVDLDGTVVDYVGGVADVEKRRVAFVGDPSTRMMEDHLRILRYFRFFGQIAAENAEHDKEILNAIRMVRQGLKGVSPERIWTEMKRIVIGRQAPAVVRCMLAECDLTSLVGLPDSAATAASLDRFEAVFARGTRCGRVAVSLESMTMIAALFDAPEHIDDFCKRTKLSNKERRLGKFILARRADAESSVEDAKYWRDMVMTMQWSSSCNGHRKERKLRKCLQLAISVGAPYEIIELIKELFNSSDVLRDLMAKGVAGVPISKKTKKLLIERYVESPFSLSKEELLELVLSSENPQGHEEQKVADVKN